MGLDEKFRSELEGELPELRFSFQHIASDAHKSRRLVYVSERRARKENIPLDTVWNHLVLVSYEEIVIYALEVYVYESNDVITLFVSRADTTGYYTGSKPVSFALITRAILRTLISLYCQKRIRVCLFAKAEPQYLFPDSGKNPKKHVLSDAGLVSWWAKVLDGLSQQFTSARATLQIPGAEPSSIKARFPASPLLNWEVGDILWPEGSTLPAIRCIPRFPDDPKTRFLDDLVAEKRCKKVFRDQFWLELSSRQEFRLGTTVGIFGIEGTPVKKETPKGFLTVKPRAYGDLRELMVSLSYGTEEDARSSSEELWNKLRHTAKFDVVGKRPPQVARKAPDAPSVNVLNTSLIRKRKKPT